MSVAVADPPRAPLLARPTLEVEQPGTSARAITAAPWVLLGLFLAAELIYCALQVNGPFLDEGIYVVGFSFPVVPSGQARIRVQVSAAHSQQDLEFAIRAFTKVRDELGL